MEKIYKCGLYIGRFQPIHIGHESIIRKMLDECDQVIIAIGSAQESGTKRNPFTFEQRADFITNVFYRERLSGQMIIMPLNDREVPSNDASWGDYVFRSVYAWCRVRPDAIYEGEEEERNTWYDNLDVDVVRVSRSLIRVSATLVRQLLESTIPSYEIWEVIPKAIHYRIPEMREVVKYERKN